MSPLHYLNQSINLLFQGKYTRLKYPKNNKESMLSLQIEMQIQQQELLSMLNIALSICNKKANHKNDSLFNNIYFSIPKARISTPNMH